MAIKLKFPDMKPIRFRRQRIQPDFNLTSNVPEKLSHSELVKLIGKFKLGFTDGEDNKGIKIKLSKRNLNINKSNYYDPSWTYDLFPVINFTNDGSNITILDLYSLFSGDPQITLAYSIDEFPGFDSPDLESWTENSFIEVIDSNDRVIDEYTLTSKIMDPSEDLYMLSRNSSNYYIYVFVTGNLLDGDSDFTAMSSCTVSQSNSWKSLGWSIQYSDTDLVIDKSLYPSSYYYNFPLFSVMDSSGNPIKLITSDSNEIPSPVMALVVFSSIPVPSNISEIGLTAWISEHGLYAGQIDFPMNSYHYSMQDLLYRRPSDFTALDELSEYYVTGLVISVVGFTQGSVDLLVGSSLKVTLTGDSWMDSTPQFALEFESSGVTPSGVVRDTVWTDGVNYYALNNLVNKDTLELTPVTWNIDQNIVGMNVWTDGYNIYYHSPIGGTYKLDKINSRWESITWNFGDGVTRSLNPRDIWSDLESIYYNDETSSLKLDIKTNTWNPVTWELNGIKQFLGRNVWSYYNAKIYVGDSGVEPTNLNYSITPGSYRLDPVDLFNSNPELSQVISGENTWVINGEVYTYNKLGTQGVTDGYLKFVYTGNSGFEIAQASGDAFPNDLFSIDSNCYSSRQMNTFKLLEETNPVINEIRAGGGSLKLKKVTQ